MYNHHYPPNIYTLKTWFQRQLTLKKSRIIQYVKEQNKSIGEKEIRMRFTVSLYELQMCGLISENKHTKCTFEKLFFAKTNYHKLDWQNKFNLKNCKNGNHNLIKNFPIKDYSYQASKIFRLLLFSFQLAIRSCWCLIFQQFNLSFLIKPLLEIFYS